MSYGLKISQGNLVIGANGKLQKVTDLEKLVQSCLKILVTSVGSNPFHPTYGSLLGKSIIGNIFDDSFVSNTASTQIKNSLEMLQRAQKQQSTFQILTPGEILAAIKQISVTRNQIDPRYFSIVVEILSGNVKIERLEFVSSL